MADIEELTAIYMDVSQGDTTTTERQEDQRGRWISNTNTNQQIRSTIEEMRDRYDLSTRLSTDQLVTLVRAFFEGGGDTAIARRLGDASLDKTVARARLGLHLFRKGDITADFDLETLNECFEAGNSGAECARRLNIAASTANQYRRVLKVEKEAEKVDYKYYNQFHHFCVESSDVEYEDSDFGEEPNFEDGLTDAVAGAGADNPQLQ
jgi:hypothetical protein